MFGVRFTGLRASDADYKLVTSLFGHVRIRWNALHNPPGNTASEPFMRVWKQLAVGIGLIAAGTVAAVRFVPGADAMLLNAGMPETLVAAVAPEKAATGGQGAGGQGGNPQRGGQPTLVTTQAVANGVVNDKLEAIGDGEAITSVVVMPMVAGTLAKVEVQSGAKVEAGQVLARLDDASEQIAVNVAKLALSSAQEKVDRYKGLKATLTRVEIDEAQRALDEAKLALATAELNLSRKIITAPISGITGIVTVNPGDNVTTQTQIATIDDRSEVLVDFWVPERFASAIMVGAPVDAAAISRPGEVHAGAVEAVDNRIDAASRTIRVRAKIPNPDDRLRAGMSFTVSMKFAGESYPAVDPLSVQWDSKGSYVWRMKDGKAERVPVKIIQRNPENVLVDGPLVAGDMVVSEGMQRVRQGAKLTASNEARGGAS